jgi:hypothetical protein
MIPRDAKPKRRFDPEPVGRGRSAEGAQPGNEMEEMAA